VGLTPEAQLATMGEAAVRRSSIFGAATTAARVEDTAAAGWGRHKYVGMFGTHPDYQQRGIGAAVLSYLNAEADKLGLPVFLYTANVRCA
jgi:GNAT superfamily N-acetyltransferase